MVFIAAANNTDKAKAAKRAALKVKSSGAKNVDLCWVFFSYPDFHSYHLETIADILKCRVIIGSSMPFIYTQAGLPNDIACVCFDNVDFSTFYLSDIKESNAPLRLESLVRQLISSSHHFKEGMLLSFFDADIDYPPSLARALQRAVSFSTPFMGVSASIITGNKVKPATVIAKGRILKNSLVGVYLKNVESAFAFASGFRPLGRLAEVTSYSKNIVKSIENKPAVSLYQKYFGPKYSLLNAGALNLISTLYPLGFQKERKSFVIRSPIRMRIDGSLEFWGDIPSSRCQFTISTKKNLIESTVQAFKKAITKISSAEMVLIVDSVARLKIISSSYYRILEAVKEIAGSVPILGLGTLYSLGNLSPVLGYPCVDVLDHMVTVVVVGKSNE